MRVNPETGNEVTDLDVNVYLGKAWGLRVRYSITAYNKMTIAKDAIDNPVYLICLEASFAPYEEPANNLPVYHTARGSGQMEGDAWYLLRGDRCQLHART